MPNNTEDGAKKPFNWRMFLIGLVTSLVVSFACSQVVTFALTEKLVESAVDMHVLGAQFITMAGDMTCNNAADKNERDDKVAQAETLMRDARQLLLHPNGFFPMDRVTNLQLSFLKSQTATIVVQGSVCWHDHR